jgi:endonuclease YncB( thermonuclease family)
LIKIPALSALITVLKRVLNIAPSMIIRLFIFDIILFHGNAQASGRFTGVVTHVSDGDTLWVQADSGGPAQKLRLDGIDAPEICQSGGEAARQTLAERALHKRVRVAIKRYDSYGRGLAKVEIQGQDLAAQLVLAGQAWSYRWQHSQGPYAREETLARQARRGLFAQPDPELPRAFRQRHGSCHVAGQ